MLTSLINYFNPNSNETAPSTRLERIRARSMQKVFCKACKHYYAYGNYYTHLKSMKHMKNENVLKHLNL